MSLKINVSSGNFFYKKKTLVRPNNLYRCQTQRLFICLSACLYANNSQTVGPILICFFLWVIGPLPSLQVIECTRSENVRPIRINLSLNANAAFTVKDSEELLI